MKLICTFVFAYADCCFSYAAAHFCCPSCISSTANRHLLRALARVGAGAYEFFDSKVKSKWETKVII